MASFGTQQSSDQEFTLDCLPLDCIICICEFLSAEDLSRFSRVCRLFHEATLIGYLWRRHCLTRWIFCDILQISEGPQRWKRYFQGRRKVETRIDQLRPGRDYMVKTLRGHEQDITAAVVIAGGNVNWENPSPPLVVSLSADGCVKAWDKMQVKPVWSLEGEQVSCLAADETTLELATGKPDGSITFWDTQTWTIKATLLSTTGAVSTIQYGRVKGSKLPATFVLTHVTGGPGVMDQMEVWDRSTAVNTSSPSDQTQQGGPATKPLFELWAPSHSGKVQLSSSGLLAMPALMGDVHVWQLSSLSSTDPSPLAPHVTLHTQDTVDCSYWLSPGCLATHYRMSTQIEIWDIGAHLQAVKKAGRNLYDDTNIYNPVKTVSNELPASSMCVANGLLITGDPDGNVRVLSPTSTECLQKFSNHKGLVTDLYADRFRVLSCSRDFSIRVYRWTKPQGSDAKPQLESRYTLLGGSVAHKTHDGFRQLLCEASSCIGIAGNQLKFYTFAWKLDSK